MLPSDTLLQNRYRIVRLLGQGGMGAVYLAIDERLGHEIALKQMFHAQQEVLSKAFEREAKLLARLHHHCLPKVSDHFSEADSRYLVMQYIVGDDLGVHLEKTQHPFPLTEVLRWADNLLDALEYLHRQTPPILHRDIKPQNLKINPHGELFLLDFGLAKDTTTNLAKASSTPSVLGYTLNYAPIEQIDRRGTTPATDIYAFCATLYHLLTNQLPTDALSRLFAKSEALPDTLIPANEINPQIPPQIAKVLHFGMAMRAEDRPNASQLRQLLKNPPSVSLKNSAISLESAKTQPNFDSYSDVNTPIDEVRITSSEFPNNISTPSAKNFASPTESIVRTTQNTFIPNTQLPKAAAKSKRSFIIVAVGLIVLLFGAGLSAAIIGYNKFASSPTPNPTPLPVATAQNTPNITPTIESSPMPSNTVNQNIEQTIKPIEKQISPKTPPVKTLPPKTTSTQKTNPPIKNSSDSKKEKLPPIIIPQ
jgi:serine/threonine protein kinase